MEILLSLLIVVICFGYGIIVAKNLLFMILKSENEKLNWKEFRKDIDWVGFISLGIAFLIIISVGIFNIVKIFTS